MEKETRYKLGLSEPHNKILGNVSIIEDLTDKDTPNNFMVVMAGGGVKMLNDECIESIDAVCFTEARYVNFLSDDLGEYMSEVDYPIEIAFTSNKDPGDKYRVVSVGDIAERLCISKKRVYERLVQLYQNHYDCIEEKQHRAELTLNDLRYYARNENN